MIRRVSHVTVYVLDQDSAREFYVERLGLEVRTEAGLAAGIRWLTVRPKGQPDVELILMPVSGPAVRAEHADALRALVAAGAIGVGVLETDDVRRDYEALKAKGVRFRQEPKEEFYGIEAIVEDDSGNWFSLTQRTGA